MGMDSYDIYQKPEEIENLSIERMMGPVGIRPAMHGCRMSFQSPEKSDSTNYRFGDRDLTLAINLHRKGDSHSAFLRMIWFWFEIDAPLSFWLHFEKYKYTHMIDMDIESRSESSMHTILKKKLSRDRFTKETPRGIIEEVNRLIDERDFKRAVDSLPKGFKQKRMVNMNMQTLLNVIKQRNGHRLDEWAIFIKKVKETFPFLDSFLEERG